MSRKNEISSFISKRLSTFERQSEKTQVNAELAQLRRGVGKNPGEIPQIYGLFLKGMPEDFWDKSGNITKEEWSCYITLTMYALHQQGNDIKLHNMHTDKDVSIGTALNYYVCKLRDENAVSRIQKKIQILVSSKDIKELSYHMRNIITILRSEGIRINYKMLSQDIYDFQFAESKNKVCLRWAQDFYKKNKGEIE